MEILLEDLTEVSATQLGSIAIRGVIDDVKLDTKNIDSVYMGNVLSANLGQSLARQVAKLAGIPDKVDCTKVNKVCAVGIKATIIGTQQISIRIGKFSYNRRNGKHE